MDMAPVYDQTATPAQGREAGKARFPADFCTEIEHWEWRVAAAIGNLRQRRIPEAIGRVAFGMAMNGALSPPLPVGPCKNPP